MAGELLFEEIFETARQVARRDAVRRTFAVAERGEVLRLVETHCEPPGALGHMVPAVALEQGRRRTMDHHRQDLALAAQRHVRGTAAETHR
ncbi:MAG TPA: hypothetical protein VGS80_21285, partial [Ktedonobacterales bacterium]|nr:hypothetical protein [Ktedonobacterales bacterium]